jgi:hypothetical protein
MTIYELKKIIKKKLTEVGYDPENVRIRNKKVEVRHGYFYRHGMDENKFARSIQEKIGPEFKVTGEDNWNPWPKDSFFAAIITEPIQQNSSILSLSA